MLRLPAASVLVGPLLCDGVKRAGSSSKSRWTVEAAQADVGVAAENLIFDGFGHVEREEREKQCGMVVQCLTSVGLFYDIRM